MKNNQPIVMELVTAIEICCRQVNTMTTLTGRSWQMVDVQKLINARVEEFKMLYPEIPVDSAFTVENNVEGVMFIAANQIFRDYVDEVEQQRAIPVPIEISSFLNNTLH